MSASFSSSSSSSSSYSSLDIPSSVSSSYQFVTTGDSIETESGSVIGHGTYCESNSLNDHISSSSSIPSDPSIIDTRRVTASLSGYVDRVNKLISVRAFHSRYSGDVGDVVVGRVVDIADKRWKVEIGCRQLSSLNISSVYLDGSQRRRTAEDALAMRSFFSEGDLISAEVQKIRQDGALALHTRNMKYGKLEGGLLIQAPHTLIKRCKQHFQSLPCKVEIILGHNGNIWIYETQPIENQQQQSTQSSTNNDNNSSSRSIIVTPAGRERVSRVRNSIIALCHMGLGIWSESIMDVYLESIERGLNAASMLNPDIIPIITQSARRKIAANR